MFTPDLRVVRPALLAAMLAGAIPGCQARQPAPTSVTPAGAAQGVAAPVAGVPVAFPQYPALSPDGATLVFSWMGDLWGVPSGGGTAERLTSHPADELRSVFSPDGSLLAFESERDGARNLYVAPIGRSATGLSLGAIRRATISDRAQQLGGFSADGKSLYYASAHEPAIFRGTHLWSVPVPTSTESLAAPVARLCEAYGSGPHASADGSSVVFHRVRLDATRPKYAGSGAPDVWSMDVKSGAFTQLTKDNHSDADAYPLPDGSVVFLSSRSGQNNLWRIAKGGSDAQAVQLTDFKPGVGPGAGVPSIGHGVRDFSVPVGGWTGTFVVWDTIYTIDFHAGKPEAKAVAIAAAGDSASGVDTQRINAGRTLSTAALSPDGRTLATIARGEVFVRSTDKDRPTRRVTGTDKAGATRARDLAWSPDGKTLYFTIDAPGAGGSTFIAQASVVLTRDDVHPEEKKDDADAEKKDDDKKDAGEEKKGEEPEAKAEPAGAPEPGGRGGGGRRGGRGGAGGGASGPGASLASRAKGGKDDPGQRWADAVTFKVEPFLKDAKDLSGPLPSPDGKWMIVSRDLGDLVLIDMDKLGKARSAAPGSAEIPGDAQRVLLTSWNEPEASWAGDSHHIVYAVEDVNYNSDIWLMDALAEPGTEAAKPINLSAHPDEDRSPRLSADGKVLYFLSDRDSDTNGEFELYAISLDRKLDGLRAYELADYFKDAADAAKKRKPLAVAKPEAKKDEGKKDDAKKDEPKADAAKDEPAKDPEKKDGEKKADAPKSEAKKPKPFTYDNSDLATAYKRVRKIPNIPSRVNNLAITPAGDRVLFTASSDGATSFQSTDYLGKDKKTVFAGGASDVSLSLTGDKVLFISSGRADPAGGPGEDRPRGGGGEAYLGKPAGGEAERLPIEGPLTIDVEAQQRQKFQDGAHLMGKRFYHPTLKGIDYKGITDHYTKLAGKTRTDSEFNRIMNMFWGELDCSHVGTTGGRSTAGEPTPIGYLGIDAVPDKGGYRVTRVIPTGPADRPSSRLAVGDVIRSVAGKPLAPSADALPTIDLHAALAHTVGQETLLELNPQPLPPKADDAKKTEEKSAEPKARYVLIAPIGAAADGTLRYQDQVRLNAEQVSKLSNGTLGYLHIRGMDLPSARDFERDLFAAADGKAGLIIDVRDNGGGFTADILLSSLTAPRHARTYARGMDFKSLPQDAYPRDRRLIYGYSRPISVLINFNSFSNAEIFAHAIKTIGRGKLVGTATYGGVISTGAATLIDGTNIRTPFRGWYLPGDVDMESHGAQPDVAVEMTPADEAAGKDPQIEAAVKELMQRAK